MDYEEYKPAIRLGGSLAPSGSGTFPIARACDILMPDESRLDEYIENMGGGSGEGGYDGDTGSIDYTTVWQLYSAVAPTNSSLYVTFNANGEEFVRILHTTLLISFYRSDGTYIQVWSSRAGWREEAYKTITILDKITDSDIRVWLDINAHLISGSLEGTVTRDPDRTADLPTIRFVGFSTDTGSFYAPNEWYFTIEVVGGGRVRIGDYLELCAMRTCKRPQSDKKAGHKRQRLRSLNRHLIKDTSKKYITLVVTSNKETQLFKNDRNAVVEGGCRSNIYLRLKRPFFDENGYENSAKFSNTISLQRSYDLESRHIAIK